MEKIFDIAKDSEQKWGVIAQGIDGNFEELSNKVNGIENYNGVYKGDYSLNSTIFTKDNIPSGNDIDIKVSPQNTQFNILVKDSGNNIIKDFRMSKL